MTSGSSVVPLRQPDEVDDPLTAVPRSGARRLPAQAIEAEAEAFLAAMRGVQLPGGRERPTWHGLGLASPRPDQGPKRSVQTGIGVEPRGSPDPVEVRRVKLRDRGAGEAGADRIRFISAILPRWARRTRSVEPRGSPDLDAPLPILYLRGVSMGDLQDALGALLGKEAPRCRAPRARRLRCDRSFSRTAAAARLRDEWQADHARRQRRDLAARRHVYVWADGVCLQAHMDLRLDCTLVLIRATSEGWKELLGFQVGMRGSARHRAHGAMGASCWSISRHAASRSHPVRPELRSHSVRRCARLLEGAR